MLQTSPQTQIIMMEGLRLICGRYSSVGIVRNTINLSFLGSLIQHRI